MQNSDLVDVVIVFNGKPALIYNSVNKIRPNIGLNPRVFNRLIKNLPECKYYFLMHDVQHFSKENCAILFYEIIKPKKRIYIWKSLFQTNDVFVQINYLPIL